FDFEWFSGGGRSLFRIKGPGRPWDDVDEFLNALRNGNTVSKRPGKERQGSAPYDFGEAAGGAWGRRRLAPAQAGLERGGRRRFPLAGGGILRVGPGFLDFGAAGGRCPVEDLVETSVKEERTTGSTESCSRPTCNCCGPRSDVLYFRRRGAGADVRVVLSDLAN